MRLILTCSIVLAGLLGEAQGVGKMVEQTGRKVVAGAAYSLLERGKMPDRDSIIRPSGVRRAMWAS